MGGSGTIRNEAVWSLLLPACALAAADFALAARSVTTWAVFAVASLGALACLAWLAWRAMQRYLVDARLDPAPARGHFLRGPAAAMLGCMALALAVPMLAQWTGFDGSVMSFRGRRTIAHADAPQLFWLTSACWLAVSTGLAWFGLLFASQIRRLAREPQRLREWISVR